MLGIAAVDASTLPRERQPLTTVMRGMGRDSTSVVDARYDRHFTENRAATGVSTVIAKGRFFINGWALPANQGNYAVRAPNGYLVNQTPWLLRDAANGTGKGGYKAQKPAATYAAAALAVATGIVPGQEVRLYDTDADDHVDLIEADYKECVLVGRIHRNSDGSYRLLRDDLDRAARSESQDQLYLLYLTLNGSEQDIGARFGGFRYSGFEQSVQPGGQPPTPSRT
ncbi:hypothetical protein OU995_14050 [Roseateles sp. SL47]|uniref:hypothetical protein n=1 Tax=Roseateles sp. SL47 TaxID=2995138 RepID=UPI00226DFAF6|nr:hypothetical protein [Roseateles sp. SL47]WAC70746.1 hypothetical protein OU995_14050 [Roseateles sp. SL47]